LGFFKRKTIGRDISLPIEKNKRVSPFVKQEKKAGFFFISPCFSILLFVIVLPLTFSFIVSFYNYTFIAPTFNKFIEFENYISIFSDSYFWHSFSTTLKFVFLVVSIEFAIGFFISLMLNRDIAFKNIYYTILTIPMLMSPIVVALFWKMLLHPNLGIINFIIKKIGDTRNAFWSVLFVDIWQQVSFMILVLLSGLVSLPKEVFEAAEIDGVSEVQKFFYIILPMMKPVIFAAITLRIIFAFRTFDLVYILTRGGPGIATDVLSYYIYRLTFMSLDMGKAAAASYILLPTIMIFIVIAFKLVFRSASE